MSDNVRPHTYISPPRHAIHLYPSKRLQKRRSADEDDIIDGAGLSDTGGDGQEATDDDSAGDVSVFNGDFDPADELIMPTINTHDIDTVDFEPIIIDEP